MIDRHYVLTLDIRVDDVGELWDAAAQCAAGTASFPEDDIVDTIGPRDDPGIADCLMLLLQPAPLAGCTLLGLNCAQSAALPTAADTSSPPNDPSLSRRPGVSGHLTIGAFVSTLCDNAIGSLGRAAPDALPFV